MGTFKLHISCTQAMCSLQYRPHMDHAKDIRRGGAAAPPPPFVHTGNGPYVACSVGLHRACVQLMCNFNLPICGLDM